MLAFTAMEKPLPCNDSLKSSCTLQQTPSFSIPNSNELPFTCFQLSEQGLANAIFLRNKLRPQTVNSWMLVAKFK
jgi:hypothetical protein